MQVRILADAADELEQAALWYERESPELGVRLVEAFELSLIHISEPTRPY